MTNIKTYSFDRHQKSNSLFWKLLLASAFIHFFYIGFKVIELPVAKVVQPSSPLKLKIISAKKRKQVVETDQKENREALERARDVFLGKKNSAVKKQSIAKNIGKFNNDGGTATKRSKSQKKGERAKKFSLSDLSFKKNLLIVPKKDVKSKNNLGKSAGGALLRSSSNDHVKNIPLGDITQLNTTEFKFYGFYHRIKQKLEQHWGNTLRQKAKDLYKRGGTIRGKGEKLTALLVVLDAKGNILNVQLKSTSGVEELDEAAVESFNRAGPFPNPPREMLKLGKAFIEWGFVVKT